MDFATCLCERCGDHIPPFLARQISESYQKFGVVDICEKCGDKADKFINYWGPKRLDDLEKLRVYLQSGHLSKTKTSRRFNQLTQAGYY